MFRVRARQTGNKPNTPKNKVDKPKKQSTKTPDNKSDPFEDDTDMDSEGESPTASLPLPSLPAFFDNIVFYIGRDIHKEERRVLKRYIIAYKGYSFQFSFTLSFGLKPPLKPSFLFLILDLFKLHA